MKGPVLAMASVSKRYGRTTVFKGVSLQLWPDEIVGIIGPNGAGKTTLLRMLVGLVHPDEGTVVNGAAAAHKVRPIEYFGGESTLPGSVRLSSWWRLVAGTAAGLGAERRARLRTLSRGTRQRIGLEAALHNVDSALVVLDEPWEGLDPNASRWLSETLRDRRRAGATVVVSSHRLYDLAGVCDRYAFLAQGTLTCYRADELDPKEQVSAEKLLATLDRMAHS